MVNDAYNVGHHRNRRPGTLPELARPGLVRDSLRQDDGESSASHHVVHNLVLFETSIHLFLVTSAGKMPEILDSKVMYAWCACVMMLSLWYRMAACFNGDEVWYCVVSLLLFSD